MTTRDEYIQQLKTRLDEWSAQIDELDAKARQSQAEAKEQLQARVNELKNKRQEVQVKLSQLTGASTETWETMKTGAEVLWEDLKQTLSESKAAFLKGMEEESKHR